MKITTLHDDSHGFPVIIADDGSVMDYAAGIRAIRENMDLSPSEFGSRIGASRRTVEGWEQGRAPSTMALMAIKHMIEQ